MRLEFVRLLQIQRDLYDIPRGPERFEAYLRTLVDPQTGDLALPLTAMNPMGKDHLPALLDEYLRLDADGAAEKVVSGIAEKYPNLAGSFKVSLIIADDLKGGWTNRYASEFNYRLETDALHKRGWSVGILWTSEPPTIETAIQEARMAGYRAVYLEQHGPARTLREMLAQEGFVAAMAGCIEPVLDPEDLDYTRQVMAPLLEAGDRPTIMAALFGDEAARQLGYPPQGLSHRAGFAWALHEAQALRSPAALLK
ncbi:MAG: hypothetical protein AB1898_13325 [Acidobacteriota bacterium]